jgi:UDP-N-acetylmuramoylalanine--D-glutamate ligase
MSVDNAPSKNGLTLSQFTNFCGGISFLPAQEQNRRINAVWNDSRKVGKGDLFVAIKTENDDGHNYVKNALLQGAAAALVSKKKLSLFSSDEKARLIAVGNPLIALQRAASRYRSTLKCRIVGITGSSGKTTSRSFVSAVLRQSHTVGETLGNWNNHIGVPLSLLRFLGAETAGVLEMGANHEREIHTLSTIARPDIGIITNIGYAHIGYFGSLANIAKAKYEIIDGMRKNGALLLNGDDPQLVKLGKSCTMNVVYFGMSKRCHVRAVNVTLTSSMQVRFTVDGEEYELPMPGSHFVYSALAAIYVGRCFGVEKSGIDRAFSALQPVAMRGAIENKAGKTFIIDCYNANPSSMKSGIALLSEVAGNKPKAAIVGDMLELGKFSTRLHTALGKQLAAAHVERILAVGEFSAAVAKGAAAGGAKRKNIVIAKDSELAVPLAKNLLKPGDTVLLKGSRGIHLETVYQGLDPVMTPAISSPRNSYPKAYVPKRAAVIGAARSGIGAAKFLWSKGVNVFVSDTCSTEKLDKLLCASGLKGVGREAENHTDAVLENDVIVLSPGVPSDIPILKKAKSRGIPVWSEVELAYRFTDATFLAITGSSGKSTTTCMLGAVLGAAGKPHAVAGNIGLPLVNVIGKLGADAFVAAEISSFQLETIDLFRPKTAAVLNLMKNHLDRYNNEEAYYDAKKEIARNFNFENRLVLNSRDARLVEWAAVMGLKTGIIFFGAPFGRECVWCEDGAVWTSVGGRVRVLFETKNMYLSGPHNWDNACAAAAVAISAGIDDGAVARGVCGFKGLAHRLEYIDEIDNVKFYNDSKATTAESVLCAVTSFARNVHLIAGGRDKRCDFSILREAIRLNVKSVHLIGEAAKRMFCEWQGLAPLVIHESLESAIRAAQEIALPGDVVVLSPGCSSFDMFDNYEHRGEMFSMVVRKMKEETR